MAELEIAYKLDKYTREALVLTIGPYVALLVESEGTTEEMVVMARYGERFVHKTAQILHIPVEIALEELNKLVKQEREYWHRMEVMESIYRPRGHHGH